MLELAKYGCCAVEELEVWQPEQNRVRSGYTVVWKLGLPAVGSAGNCLPPPAACTGGATSCTLVVEAEPAPIHAWIPTSTVAAQAEGTRTQQLCPSPPFRTSVEWLACP